ncbi:MAG: glycosyltransferase family 2 protein [Parcubacteria group bacterium]|nr:glycosyltransferase family 2 protein [Parcubacteria group bacterium]
MKRNKEVLLSLIIPAYNEEKRISHTIKKFINYLSKQNYTYEIMIVDDGSTDDTYDLLVNYSTKYSFVKIIRNAKNMGKGYSVRRGIEEAKGEYILFSDADLAVRPEYIYPIIKELKSEVDIVIGSRAEEGAKIENPQPKLRGRLGRLFNSIVKRFIIHDFLDTQCGFKGFKANVAKTICKEQTLYGYCFDVEILLIAQKNGYSIKEVPVVWNDKNGSKLGILDSPAILLEIVKIKINQIKGRYNKNNAG